MITPDRAIELSKRRGEKFAMEHRRNTVIENPQKFDGFILQKENLENLGANNDRPFIASNKVRTY